MSEERTKPSLMFITLIVAICLIIVFMVFLIIGMLNNVSCEYKADSTPNIINEYEIVSYEEHLCHTYANRVWCIVGE